MHYSASRRLPFIYLGALILSLHYSFIVYINSNFLSQFFSAKTLSLLYTSGSILTLIGFIVSTSLIKRFGNFKLLIIGVLCEIAALVGLFQATDLTALKIFFIIHQALPPLLLLGLDIILEGALRTEVAVGKIRSLYLTAINTAFVISPLIVGKIISFSSYRMIYLISAVFCIGFLFLVVEKFKSIKTRELKEVNFLESARVFLKHKDLCRIFLANFILQGFYAIMVIYTPLYLHSVIGFDWQSIGAIFTVMLIPFVLFEAPLGRLFDSRHTEKDTLITGFIIMGIIASSMFFIHSASIATWMILLFLSRVGASFVEVSSEYAFFKRISDQDVGLISIFKMTSPLAYTLVPLFVQIFISRTPLNIMFLLVGISMSLGILFSAKIRTTRVKN